MKYCATLLAVNNMEKAKKFYMGLLGQEIAMDLGGNVGFRSGLALQEMGLWTNLLLEKPIESVVMRNNASELYFETENLDEFMGEFAKWDGLEKVHPLKEQPWGQRVIRFYDYDGHIVEVGETMENVVKRLLKEGMSVEEASEKSMYPIPFVEKMKSEMES